MGKVRNDKSTVASC